MRRTDSIDPNNVHEDGTPQGGTVCDAASSIPEGVEGAGGEGGAPRSPRRGLTDERHRADVESSGLSVDHCERAGWYSESDDTVLTEMLKVDGHEGNWRKRNFSGAMVIPYYLPGETQRYAFRLKPNVPEPQRRKDGTIKIDKETGKPKVKKYVQKSGTGAIVYFPRAVSPADFLDPEKTLIFTEGEKKAEILAALGFVVVGLGGVDSFLNSKDAQEDHGIRLHPLLLEHLAIEGRDFVIIYDADYATNHRVLTAARKLSGVLQQQGARSVRFVGTPAAEDDPKQGIDDYHAKLEAVEAGSGADAVRALVKDAKEIADPIRPVTKQLRLAPARALSPLFGAPKMSSKHRAWLNDVGISDDVLRVIQPETLGWDFGGNKRLAELGIKSEGEWEAKHFKGDGLLLLNNQEGNAWVARPSEPWEPVKGPGRPKKDGVKAERYCFQGIKPRPWAPMRPFSSRDDIYFITDDVLAALLACSLGYWSVVIPNPNDLGVRADRRDVTSKIVPYEELLPAVQSGGNVFIHLFDEGDVERVARTLVVAGHRRATKFFRLEFSDRVTGRALNLAQWAAKYEDKKEFELDLEDAMQSSVREGQILASHEIADLAMPVLLVSHHVAENGRQIRELIHDDSRFLVYGGEMAYVAETKFGAKVVRHTADGMYGMLTDLMKFQVFDRRTKVPKLNDTPPPDKLVKYVLNKGGESAPELGKPLRVLNGLVTTPTFLADGRILMTPGYDEASGIYYSHTDCPRDFHVPEEPTSEDIRGAKELFDEILCEFPFVDESAKSAFLAMIIGRVARYAYSGPQLGTIVTSLGEGKGTGKSSLMWGGAAIATGRKDVVTDVKWTADEAELEKRIITKLKSGVPFLLFDNLKNHGTFESAMIDNMITNPIFTGRLLSQNSEIVVPTSSFSLVANGNGLQLGGDASRRWTAVVLDKSKLPSNFVPTFDFQDYAIENRWHLLANIMTLLRAWFRAGKPIHGGRKQPKFEGWDDVVRSCIIWAGWADPIESMRLVEAKDATESSEISVLLRLMQSTYTGMRTWKARDMLKTLYDLDGTRRVNTRLDPDAQDAAAILFGDFAPSIKAVGQALSRWRGTVHEDLVLRDVGRKTKPEYQVTMARADEEDASFVSAGVLPTSAEAAPF